MRKTVREKEIEAACVTEVKKRGGLCLKFTSPGTNGVPDRIVLMPGGKTFFIEVKAPNKQATKQQRYIHKQLRELGFAVKIIDCFNAVEGLFDEV